MVDDERHTRVVSRAQSHCVGTGRARRSRPCRAELYVAIGSGYSYAAIDTLLQMIVQRRLPVSLALATKIADWVNAYVYSGDAPRLHELLYVIRSSRY